MDEPEYTEFLKGKSGYFSRRSPDKETPNEDSLALFPFDRQSGVLVIADGLGGQPGGAVASKLAIECLETALRNAIDKEESLRDAILNAFEMANQQIIALGTGSATTLSIVEINKDIIRPYHVGDSVILLTGQRGKIKFQSVPHSPVGYAVESGILDVNDAVHHEQRHLISNAVGTKDMRIEIGPEVKMSARDTLLIASDGLFDNLYEDEIVSAIRVGKIDKVCNKLLDLADQRMRDRESELPSKPDDLSYLVFRL